MNKKGYRNISLARPPTDGLYRQVSRKLQYIRWTDNAFFTFIKHMGVDHRGSDILVSKTLYFANQI